ncbi:MAG: TatD family hydrolase [Ilumatobacteraceae bacterium]
MNDNLFWVDTHCHVYDEKIEGGTEVALSAARAAGVHKMIVIGTDAGTTQQAIALASANEDVWATVGLHPHDAKDGFDALIPFLEAKRVVAIGECGLDYYYEHSDRHVQREMFARQISIANELRLPLVVHTRDAWKETFEILDRTGIPQRTIFHCFTGGTTEATECLARGAFLSFSGIVTFKAADDVRAAAMLCPIDRMLVETDAPYLAPVPHRGKSNHPALVSFVGKFIANLRSESVAHIAQHTSHNACLAFPGIAP